MTNIDKIIKLAKGRRGGEYIHTPSELVASRLSLVNLPVYNQNNNKEIAMKDTGLSNKDEVYAGLRECFNSWMSDGDSEMPLDYQSARDGDQYCNRLGQFLALSVYEAMEGLEEESEKVLWKEVMINIDNMVNTLMAFKNRLASLSVFVDCDEPGENYGKRVEVGLGELLKDKKEEWVE